MTNIDGIEECINEFNSLLLAVVDEVLEQQPSERLIQLQKKINLIVTLHPIWPIESVGPYLNSYREQLSYNNKDFEQFFLQMDCPQVVEHLSPSTAETVLYVIEHIRILWTNTNTHNKLKHQHSIKTMLDNYREYELLAQV